VVLAAHSDPTQGSKGKGVKNRFWLMLTGTEHARYCRIICGISAKPDCVNQEPTVVSQHPDEQGYHNDREKNPRATCGQEKRQVYTVRCLYPASPVVGTQTLD
jgi:hypothetical protein